ncbi:hypothetical protein [Leptospira idonii]|uniref:Uncharacterized protein n=1 Tax=Leptospira idonii TaxID=1193500 RepID=A0A4R9M3H6_9LEPT|nr:hypothetical protein [Leptospira idonii]TGN20531.1 hypothetical protein EHS15_02755 [Leptospira idonii]
MHPFQPETSIISFFSSLVVLVGVSEFFYAKQFRSKFYFISVFFLVFAYLLFSVLDQFRISLPFYFVKQPIVSFTNLVLFLSFSFMGSYLVLPKLKTSSQLIYICLIGLGLFPFLFFHFSLGSFTELGVLERGGFVILFLVSGSIAWFQEIFFQPLADEDLEKKIPDSFVSSLFFLSLPFVIPIVSGRITEERFYFLSIDLLLASLSSVLGFLAVSQARKKLSEGFGLSLLPFFAGSALVSASLGVTHLLLIPVSFSAGLFLHLLQLWLRKKNWSDRSSLLVSGQLVAGGIGLFLPYLSLPNQEWLHPPSVMLAVQSLFLLTVFLLSCLVASAVYLLPKEGAEGKNY